MNEAVKQFAKTLNTAIRDHVRKHGLIVVGNDLLIAHDPLTGRLVVTFEVVEPILKAAE